MNVSSNLSSFENMTICQVGLLACSELFLLWKALDTCLTLFTNCITMVILCRYARLETPSNVFIAWLTLSDLFYAVSFPFTIGVTYLPSGVGWTMSCFSQLCIGVSMSMCNCLAIFMIAVDRLLYIVLSLEYHTILTVRKAYVSAASLTVISVVFTTACLLIGYRDSPPDGMCAPFLSVDQKIRSILGAPLIIFIPLTVGCYIKIGLVARKQNNSIAAFQPGALPQGNQASKFKVAKVMANVLILFTICNILLLLQPFMVRSIEGISYEVSYQLMFCIWRVNKWLNPAIYVLGSKRFRSQIKSFVRDTPLSETMSFL